MTEAQPRVIVVDDNPQNLKLLSYLLGRHGYEVREATSASAFLDVLREFRPNLVLMDLQLPVIDGFELTRRLKSDPATRDICVVAVTAYAMKGDEERARSAGCDAYVSKPIDTRALPGVLSRLLEAARGAPR